MLKKCKIKIAYFDSFVIESCFWLGKKMQKSHKHPGSNYNI